MSNPIKIFGPDGFIDDTGYEKTRGEVVVALSDLHKQLKKLSALNKSDFMELSKGISSINTEMLKLNDLRGQINPLDPKALSEIQKIYPALKKLVEVKGEITKAAKMQAEAAQVATNSLAGLRAKAKELNTEYSKLDPTVKKDADRMRELAAESQQLIVQTKALTDATKVATKTNQVSEGSYNALSAEVSQLNKDLRMMPDVFGKNKDAAEALKKTIFDKTQTLKDFDAQTNINTRDVGKYGNAFKEVSQNMGIFGPQLEALERIQASFNAVLSATKTEQEAVSAGMVAAGPAASIFAGAMKIVKLALISTGLGAIVVLLGSLITFFTKTEEGAEALERSMAGVGAVVDVLVGKVAGFGKSIVEAFTNPAELVKSFGKFLKLAFTDPEGAATQFTKTVKNFTNGIAETGTQAKRAAQEMAALKGRMQDLEDTERDFGVQAERTGLQIDALITKSKNRTLADQQRKGFLIEAGNLERGLLNEQLKIANERVNVIKAENAVHKRNGLLRDEQLQAEQDALKSVITLTGESNNLQEKLANRMSVLTAEISEDAKKAAADRLKNDEVVLKAKLLKTSENSKEELAIKKQLIDKAADIEIAGETKTQNAVALIRTQAQIDKKKLDEDYFKFQAAELEKQIAANEKARKDQVEKEYAIIERSAQTRSGGLDKQAQEEEKKLIDRLKKKEITFDEFDKRREELGFKSAHVLLQAEIESLEAKKKVTGISADEIYEIEKELVAKKKQLYELDTENNLKEERKKLEEKKEKIEKAGQYAAQASDFLFELSANNREQELQDLQEKKDAELQKLQETAEASMRISSQDQEVQAKLQEDYANAKALKEEEFRKREAAIKNRQAKEDRAKALFDVAIYTAVAVAKALPNIPLSVIAGIMGAAQASLILSKPIPKFFRGTSFAPEGLAFVDEQGPEIIERKGKMYLGQDKGPRLTYLNRGDKVYTAGQTNRILQDPERLNQMATADQVRDSYQLGVHSLQKAQQAEKAHDRALLIAAAGNPETVGLLRKLVKATENRPEFHSNITKEGFETLVKKAGNITKYRDGIFPNGRM